MRSKNEVIKKENPINDFEMNSMKSELKTMILFETKDKPVDMSEFAILFNPLRGLHFTAHMEFNNFDMDLKIFLAMLHSKAKESLNMDEIIENRVLNVIKQI